MPLQRVDKEGDEAGAKQMGGQAAIGARKAGEHDHGVFPQLHQLPAPEMGQKWDRIKGRESLAHRTAEGRECAGRGSGRASGLMVCGCVFTVATAVPNGGVVFDGILASIQPGPKGVVPGLAGFWGVSKM
jgi:hypothetical protein